MKFFQFSVVLLALAIGAVSSQAASLSEIKADMKQRLPKIEALWSSGLVGENNSGFLEARKPLTPDQKTLVTDENSDRTSVYKAIAQSTGANLKQVGEQRAKQITQRAAKGLWLQNPDGDWYRK